MPIINCPPGTDLAEGAVRVSHCGDYVDGCYTVETLGYGNTYRLHWAMPAWDERGAPDLMQHFGTYAEAAAAAESYGINLVEAV